MSFVGVVIPLPGASRRVTVELGARIVFATLSLACLTAGSMASTHAGGAAGERNDAGAAAQEPHPDSEHPWIALARRYRAAVRAGDVEVTVAMLAPDARVWFGERKGDGRPLDASGKGPWAQWDTFFRARSSQTDFVVEGSAVRYTNLETNDWQRLIERTPLPYYVYYFFDDNDRISGKLIQGIDGLARPPDRLAEFQRWADEKHPGLVTQLMPNGDIDPSLDHARLWKKHLMEWRTDAGLPSVLERPD